MGIWHHWWCGFYFLSDLDWSAFLWHISGLVMTDQQDERLNCSVIYGALMRPAMKVGIPFNFFPVLGFIGCIIMVAFNPMVAIGYLPFAWLVGWALGKFNPDVMNVLRNYMVVYANDAEESGDSDLYVYAAF